MRRRIWRRLLCDYLSLQRGRRLFHVGALFSEIMKDNFTGSDLYRRLVNRLPPSGRVSLEGNVGSGKSTLLEALRSRPGIVVTPEPLARWRGSNLLARLYADPQRWSFAFQSEVQRARLAVQTQACDEPLHVFERSLQNNREVFMEMGRARGDLNDAEYNVLCCWYDWMQRHAEIKLDLIVYLRCRPETALARVRKRQRAEEAEISLDFLRELHDRHDRWLMPASQWTDAPQPNCDWPDASQLKSYWPETPVLVLDADQDLTTS